MMKPDSPTDLELVRGLHARDRQAFACVYGDYHAAVYNLCARILGDREEAKDVTQDVFLKAFDRPPAASADVRLRPWLFRVATNACFNLARGRRTGGPLEVEALPSAGDPYEQARSVELIEGSLAAMNERYRAALVLKDLQGVGSSELAEVLAISRPAADVLVHRARASFRRAFAALAGEGSAAPANLALVLPALSVPAGLHAVPLPPAALAPGAHVPAPTGPVLIDPGAAAAAGAGPAVGILAKITAGLSAKAAVVAAGAVVVAGGGIAAVELAGNGATTPASAEGVPAATVSHVSTAGAHGGHHSSVDDWLDHRREITDHLGDDSHSAHGAHATSGGHSAGHDGGGTTHEAPSGADHVTATSSGTTTHDAAPSSTSTAAGHDGGEPAHDGGGD
jgi:RNA polymerase sigma-70 factor (ECF subfamily)